MRSRTRHASGSRGLPGAGGARLVPDRPQRHPARLHRIGHLLAGDAAVRCAPGRAADRRSFQVLQAVRRRQIRLMERTKTRNDALAASTDGRFTCRRPASGLQLVGARRCLYADGLIPHVMYRANGQDVSLFVLNGVTRNPIRPGHVRASLADLDAGRTRRSCSCPADGERSTRRRHPIHDEGSQPLEESMSETPEIPADPPIDGSRGRRRRTQAAAGSCAPLQPEPQTVAESGVARDGGRDAGAGADLAGAGHRARR